MALLGADGLEHVAAGCNNNLNTLTEKLVQTEGVETIFSRPVFHEQVIRLPVEAKEVLDGLAANGIQGGYELSKDYPELGDAVLVCATEKRTQDEIDIFAQQLSKALTGMQGGAV
jgi:glycine dehydrogenase subunit 1